MTGEVLLVDDHADIRFLMARVLEDEGYATREAPGGEEALAAIGAHAPDLVVLDVQMPRTTGWDVLERLRAAPATVALPVILCTVKSGPQDLVHAFEAGADGFLNKPFDPAQLVAAVGEVLGCSAEERVRRRAGRLAQARA